MKWTIRRKVTYAFWCVIGVLYSAFSFAGVQVPAYNGAPYFMAYLSANQSISVNTPTKAQVNTVVYDSGGYYDAVTNFRYTPKVAGKYLVTGHCNLGATVNGVNQVQCLIYKNGSLFNGDGDTSYTTSSLAVQRATSTTSIVTMNGTTDYLELWGSISTGTTPVFNGASNLTQFQAIYLGP